MPASDDGAASSSPRASSSAAATVMEKVSSSEAVSEPEPDSSASQSAAASADESAEDAAISSAAASESGDRPEPSAASTCSTKEGDPDTDASSSSSAATVVGDGDENGRGSSPEPKAKVKAPSSAAVSEADGSASSSESISASSKGTCSTEFSEHGSGSNPGPAATAKVDSSKVVETFDAEASQTLEEHAASHNFPMHVRQCGPCRFWKHREKWSASCSATNPVSHQRETWLGHAGGGLAVCLFCAAFKGSRSRSDLGRGTGSFRRLRNIHRHAMCMEHQAAEAAWKERVRAESSHQGVELFSQAATAAPVLPILRKTVAESGGRGVVATRALLETSSSFRSFDVWREALLGDQERASVGSSSQCRRVVMSLALHERLVTQKILKEGAVFRLSADGLDRTYQVEIGTVLWTLPKALDFMLRYAGNAGWLEQLGPNGPWLVERLIGMREFPRAMDCDGKVTMLEDCVRRACLTPGGAVDLELHKHVREETRAWVSDGADLGVPLAATATFPHLGFHAWDESHSAHALLNFFERRCRNHDYGERVGNQEEATKSRKVSVYLHRVPQHCGAATAGTRHCIRKKLRLGSPAIQ